MSKLALLAIGLTLCVAALLVWNWQRGRLAERRRLARRERRAEEDRVWRERLRSR